MALSGRIGSVIGLTLRSACLVGLLVPPVHGQVRVTVRTSGESYLAGEPVFAIVDVTNIGSDPIAYSLCYGKVDLSVPRGQTRQRPNLHACGGGPSSAGVCGSAHPPLMKQNETLSFWHLLKGYRLTPGVYDLRVHGKAGVRGVDYPPPSSLGPHAQPKLKDTDHVEGREIDQTLRLVIKASTEEQLRERYAPYVADARGDGALGRTSRAREAIVEMAPPFLRETILGFAFSELDKLLTLRGLAGINTEQTRADLIEMYDKSESLRVRAEIVQEMAHIATQVEIPFLASLLPGRSTQTEDSMRYFATLGIGRIGGPEAVRVLNSIPHNLSPRVRSAIATALGNAQDASAVPVLIQMYAEEEGAKDSVCQALKTLTRYEWCDGSGDAARQVSTWKRWWQSNAAKVRIYGADACPEHGVQLPMVR